MLAVACVETGRTDQANELFDWFVDEGFRGFRTTRSSPPPSACGWRSAGHCAGSTGWRRWRPGSVWWTGHPVLLTGIMYLGSTDRFRGMVARLAGDDDAAEEYFRSAVAYNESVGAVPMAAAARSDWAELCLDRGDLEQAAALARATLEAIGDLPLVRQAGRARAVLDRVAAD